MPCYKGKHLLRVMIGRILVSCPTTIINRRRLAPLFVVLFLHSDRMHSIIPLSKHRYFLEITVLFPPFHWTYCLYFGPEVLDIGSIANNNMIHYDLCVGIPKILGFLFLFTLPEMRPQH